jgi:hypothetical protein
MVPTLNQSTTGNAATSSDGLSSASGTAPLTLTLAGKALSGAVAVTPANPGGAVALQAATPGTAQTGNANLSGTVIAGAFSGPLTGNVTGNASGSSGSTTGNAATATSAAAAPSNCSAGSAPTGILAAAFAATGCTAYVPASPATGSGSVVLATSPTIVTPSFSGPIGSNFDLGTQADLYEIANEGTTGTTVNKLAKLTGAPSTAILIGTGDTSGISGVVAAGAGTTGNAQLARAGRVSCVFDGATTAGDYVQASTTTAGDCHDAGASLPTSGQILGRVLSTNGATGTFAMTVYSPGIIGAGAGGGIGGSTGATDKALLAASGAGGATVQAPSGSANALFNSTGLLGFGVLDNAHAALQHYTGGFFGSGAGNSTLLVARGDGGAASYLAVAALEIMGPTAPTGANNLIVFDTSRKQVVFTKEWTVGFYNGSSNPGAGHAPDFSYGRGSAGTMSINSSASNDAAGAINLTVVQLVPGAVGTCGSGQKGFLRVAADGSLCSCNGTIWTATPLSGSCT